MLPGPSKACLRCAPGGRGTEPLVEFCGVRLIARYGRVMAFDGLDPWQKYVRGLQRDLRLAAMPTIDLGSVVESIRGSLATVDYAGLAHEASRALSESVLRQAQEAAREFAQRAQVALERAMPPNWRELSREEFDAAIDLSLETGINLVWAPGPSVIRELLAASGDRERANVLVARRDVILGDLEQLVAESDHARLHHLPAMARQACAAMRDGHHGPAQTHAAAALSYAVEVLFGMPRFRDAREAWEAEDPERVGMRLMKLTLIRRTLARALHRTDYAPPGFNRNASAHGVSIEQYSEPNAIASLLLLAGLVRELQALLEELDREASSSTGVGSPVSA